MSSQATGVLGRLAQIAQIKRRMAAEEKQLIGKARDLDVAWHRIDTAMGYCPGSTHQRWAKRFPAARPVSAGGKLHVECPRCGVDSDRPCRSKGGHITRPHEARLQLAKQAKQPITTDQTFRRGTTHPERTPQ